MTPSLVYQIALNKIPKVGAITAKNLIDSFGDVESLFRASKKDLLRIPRVTEEVARYIISKRALAEAESEMCFIEKNDIRPFFFEDESYPFRLKHLRDAPVMLYYKGNADLNHKRIVAIVGTRRPTESGKIYCEKLIEELRQYNVLIVSGLAYGVDITAHRKCLELEIDTIGVLGHGFRHLYPAQHREVAERMIRHGGLLTEYTADKKPDRENFPMRNRIIAGMCDALVVVETAAKGGSMISADLANQYNKDVFAFPGRLSDTYAQGCNQLIKSHRASLIESAKDIAYILRWEPQQSPRHIQRELFVELTAEEKKIIELLNKSEHIGIDKLIYETNYTSNEIATLLLNLEFKGLVKPLPGHRYMLV